MRPSRTSRQIGITCLTSLLFAGSAAGNTSSRNFEESVKNAWNESLEQTKGWNGWKADDPFDRPNIRIIERSRSIFSGSPKTRENLAHLSALADTGIRGSHQWAQYENFEDSLLKTLATRRASRISDARDAVSLLGASMLWHEIQHSYDRIELEKRSGTIARVIFQPLEMEQRGWEAGCAIWKAGAGPARGHDETPDLFRCGQSFPKAYYCRYSLSVEYVVMLAEQIRFEPKPADKLYQALNAYCAEFERVEKGNPLQVDGSFFMWSPENCLEKALSEVLAPGWVSSLESCPAEIKSGPDVRDAARKLMSALENY